MLLKTVLVLSTAKVKNRSALRVKQCMYVKLTIYMSPSAVALSISFQPQIIVYVLQALAFIEICNLKILIIFKISAFVVLQLFNNNSL